MNNKKCTKCLTGKPLNEFKENSRYKDGYAPWCSLCRREYRHYHYTKNKGRMAEQQKVYIRKNKEKRSLTLKTYFQNNKEKFRKWHRDWRLKHPPTYQDKVNGSMSKGICAALKAKKAGRHWETLVDFTLEQLIEHLEKQFKSGMTWDNYGSLWHIDHKKPISWFNFPDEKAAPFKECWSLSNLQPLLAIENSRKGNRYAH